MHAHDRNEYSDMISSPCLLIILNDTSFNPTVIFWPSTHHHASIHLSLKRAYLIAAVAPRWRWWGNAPAQAAERRTLRSPGRTHTYVPVPPLCAAAAVKRRRIPADVGVCVVYFFFLCLRFGYALWVVAVAGRAMGREMAVRWKMAVGWANGGQLWEDLGLGGWMDDG
ncbi:hypothetical protein EDC01DRAFT_120444 [Geopyxis carbonaria]|nr:hypothetical protein EDC01DRAFT_120444 [Geopyxis carbonaria]